MLFRHPLFLVELSQLIALRFLSCLIRFSLALGPRLQTYSRLRCSLLYQLKNLAALLLIGIYSCVFWETFDSGLLEMLEHLFNKLVKVEEQYQLISLWLALAYQWRAKGLNSVSSFLLILLLLSILPSSLMSTSVALLLILSLPNLIIPELLLHSVD